MSFNMDDYIDVPARIALFAAKYPEGSLQGDGYFVRDVDEKIVGYHYVARAYRTAADERPGVGTAYEPIPGKTPYTKDSEVMNAETSAWGRAIVALGFNTKKIASVEEVRARQASDGAADGPAQPSPREPAAAPTPSGTFDVPSDVQATLDNKAARSVPQDGGVPEEVVLTFGAHKGKKLIELLEGNKKEKGYLEWLAGDTFTPDSPDRKRVKGAAQTLLSLAVTEPVADDDIPF